MKKRRKGGSSESDVLEKWREWTDHQNDPGYWTGGRFNPTTRAQSGCWLTLMGSSVLVMSIVVLFGSRTHLGGPLGMAIIGALMLALGVMALRKRRQRPAQQQRRRRKRR